MVWHKGAKHEALAQHTRSSWEEQLADGVRAGHKSFWSTSEAKALPKSLLGQEVRRGERKCNGKVMNYPMCCSQGELHLFVWGLQNISH